MTAVTQADTTFTILHTSCLQLHNCQGYDCDVLQSSFDLELLENDL